MQFFCFRHSVLESCVLQESIATATALAAHSGPAFGGMSGVNYALFGYIWIRGNNDPRFGLQLDQGTITMLLIWFVVCFTGLVGNIANAAHTLGLIVGVIAGWLAAERALR